MARRVDDQDWAEGWDGTCDKVLHGIQKWIRADSAAVQLWRQLGQESTRLRGSQPEEVADLLHRLGTFPHLVSLSLLSLSDDHCWPSSSSSSSTSTIGTCTPASPKWCNPSTTSYPPTKSSTSVYPTPPHGLSPNAMRTPDSTACVNSRFTRENGRLPSATSSGISYRCAWMRACLSRHGAC